jgi:hypothetical protein
VDDLDVVNDADHRVRDRIDHVRVVAGGVGLDDADHVGRRERRREQERSEQRQPARDGMQLRHEI